MGGVAGVAVYSVNIWPLLFTYPHQRWVTGEFSVDMRLQFVEVYSKMCEGRWAGREALPPLWEHVPSLYVGRMGYHRTRYHYTGAVILYNNVFAYLDLVILHLQRAAHVGVLKEFNCTCHNLHLLRIGDKRYRLPLVSLYGCHVTHCVWQAIYRGWCTVN